MEYAAKSKNRVSLNVKIPMKKAELVHYTSGIPIHDYGSVISHVVAPKKEERFLFIAPHRPHTSATRVSKSQMERQKRRGLDFTANVFMLKTLSISKKQERVVQGSIHLRIKQTCAT